MGFASLYPSYDFVVFNQFNAPFPAAIPVANDACNR
jgi:hypothetical protein